MDRRPVILEEMKTRGRCRRVEGKAGKAVDSRDQIANRFELWIPVVALAIPHPAGLLCIALVPPMHRGRRSRSQLLLEMSGPERFSAIEPIPTESIQNEFQLVCRKLETLYSDGSRSNRGQYEDCLRVRLTGVAIPCG